MTNCWEALSVLEVDGAKGTTGGDMVSAKEKGTYQDTHLPAHAQCACQMVRSVWIDLRLLRLNL